jgi:hypothetical protein
MSLYIHVIFCICSIYVNLPQYPHQFMVVYIGIFFLSDSSYEELNELKKH